MPESTFWNGEPCEARIVTAVIGPAPRATWWCADLVGQWREVVEVKYGDKTFYLDNGPLAADKDPGGSGWRKVTVGKGLPYWPHRSAPVERVIEFRSEGG